MSWLRSKYTFSFGNYVDHDHMGFRSLRVINEDWIAPSAGFEAHPHRDMEILTYLIDGALEHHDSNGNVSTLGEGRVQLMSAGNGIVHSEMNALTDQTTHLLQIWIEADTHGLVPRYQEAALDFSGGSTVAVASKAGLEGGLDINQDVNIIAAKLGASEVLTLRQSAERHVWIQVVSGAGSALGFDVESGDGVSASGEEELLLESKQGLEVLVFDLA